MYSVNNRNRQPFSYRSYSYFLYFTAMYVHFLIFFFYIRVQSCFYFLLLKDIYKFYWAIWTLVTLYSNWGAFVLFPSGQIWVSNSHGIGKTRVTDLSCYVIIFTGLQKVSSYRLDSASNLFILISTVIILNVCWPP